MLVVDADDQETASDFTMLRNERAPDAATYTSIKLTGQAVRTETRRLAGKYDDVVIDTGGRDTTSQRAALTVADVLLVPFVPRSFDVWTLEKVGELVGEMRVANPELQGLRLHQPGGSHGRPGQRRGRRGSARHRRPGVHLIRPWGRERPSAMPRLRGLAVTELRPQDAKATHEVETLYRYLFDRRQISY